MQATPLYYRLAMSLLKPLYQLKLASKTTLPNEKQQRFSHVFPEIHTSQPIIWCHAVSLGETHTAEDLGSLGDGEGSGVGSVRLRQWC